MIFRIRKTSRYVTINNKVLRDERLSWCARGVMAHLLTLPDTDLITIEALTDRAKEGRRRVASALKELEQCGYFQRRKFKDKLGQWIWEMDVFEEPEAEIPQADSRTTVSGRMESGSIKDINTKKEEIPPTPLPPAPFAGNGFLTALAAFRRSRLAMKKPLTPEAEELLYRKLERWGEVYATQALEDAVINRWQGVFEPKTNGFKTQAEMNQGGRGRPVVI